MDFVLLEGDNDLAAGEELIDMESIRVIEAVVDPDNEVSIMKVIHTVGARILYQELRKEHIALPAPGM